MLATAPHSTFLATFCSNVLASSLVAHLPARFRKSASANAPCMSPLNDVSHTTPWQPNTHAPSSVYSLLFLIVFGSTMYPSCEVHGEVVSAARSGPRNKSYQEQHALDVSTMNTASAVCVKEVEDLAKEQATHVWSVRPRPLSGQCLSVCMALCVRGGSARSTTHHWKVI